MNKDIAKMAAKVAIPLIAALLSAFVLSKIAASPEFHAGTIEALDGKRTTVMELTAASTAASAAITLLPDDTGTPIANKLTDLTSGFLLVLCAIYLEKYLVTITGYAAFTILIPIACLLFAFNAFIKNHAITGIAIKLVTFGLAIFLVIPASVAVSNLIEDTYQSSIQNTIESAKDATAAMEESERTDTEEEKGFISGIVSSVKYGVSNAATVAENVLNNFIEALAVMLVTSCVIPIIVLLFFVWLIKIILGVDLNFPKREN